jgi:hypothetical protein
MKTLKTLVGGGKLTFPPVSTYDRIIGDRVFKLVETGGL